MKHETFINRLAQSMGCDNAKAAQLTGAFAAVLRDRASNLDSIAIPGFGNFVAIKKPDAIVEDPSTRKRSLVPPEIKIEFVASAMLKKAINK